MYAVRSHNTQGVVDSCCQLFLATWPSSVQRTLPRQGQYGLWDQVRVDHGSEWVLMLHVHEGLADHRNCTDKPSFIASSSKKVYYYFRTIYYVNVMLKYSTVTASYTCKWMYNNYYNYIWNLLKSNVSVAIKCTLTVHNLYICLYLHLHTSYIESHCRENVGGGKSEGELPN